MIVKRKHMQVEHHRNINKKHHNEITALERSVINYLEGVGGRGLKLALQDPNPCLQLLQWWKYICSVRIKVF